MDSILFEIWFYSMFLPNLPKNPVIVMDNAAFNRKRQLIEDGFLLETVRKEGSVETMHWSIDVEKLKILL